MILQELGRSCTDFGDVLLPGAVIVYFADECTCGRTHTQSPSKPLPHFLFRHFVLFCGRECHAPVLGAAVPFLMNS